MEQNSHLQAYIDFLSTKIAMARPLKIVCDCSNGPAGLIINALKKQRKEFAETVLINENIHPDFPAHGADPTTASALDDVVKAIKEHNADLGVVYDGDADRAIFVDEKGNRIPSHVIAALMTANIPGTHIADALVYEALIHTDPAIKDRIIASRVGRYYINLSMHQHSAVMGAEFSGHYYFADFWNADSAVLTTIKVMNILSAEKNTVSAILKPYGKQRIDADKIGISVSFDEIKKAVLEYIANKKVTRTSELDGLSVDFGESWINVRPSNTEPIIRITAGASDIAQIHELIAEYKTLLSK